MQRFKLFWHNLQQDLKIFLYFSVLFTVFRCLFIVVFSNYVADVPAEEIWLCLWYGFRLSLKTAGFIAIVGFVFATLPNLIMIKWPADKIRKIVQSALVVFFTVAFFARIPYYEIFASGFNIMLINGMNDDIAAIIDTAINEYQLWWRLPAALITSGMLIYVLIKLLDLKTKALNVNNKKQLWFAIAKVIIAIPIFFVFVRYGGAFNYANSINWESAERLKSKFLNEAILDDGQALYRVHKIYQAQKKVTEINFTAQELREKIAILGGNKNANTIEEALLKTVDKPILVEQPQNVIFILGETNALWPMLPKYRQMGLMNEQLELANAPNSCNVEAMLSHGIGTMPAVSGLFTGLAATNITEENMPETYRTKYATGIGKVMQDAGYTTVFWYGGMPSWREIENYALAQSFDMFYSSSDFKYTGGNAWGCPDKALFNEIYKFVQNNTDKKYFHLILTTSNHPPYTIDVVKEGFDMKKLEQNLTDDIKNSKETLNQLAHIWYADKAIGEFVKTTEKLHPDTLFVVTGDHAQRFTFAKDVDRKTSSAIPCIIHGKGINQAMLNEKVPACLMQLIPTMAELVGKPQQTYSAVLPSLFKSQRPVFNHELWIENGELKKIDANTPESLKQKAKAAQQIAAWRLVKGNKIE